MPKGVYIRSETQKKRLRNLNMGSKMPFSTRTVLLKANVGKHHSKKTCQKISMSNKGKKCPWVSKALKGVLFSDDHKRALSKAGVGKRQGDSNGNWKGGITPLYIRIRQSFEYRLWRSDVFTRDKFICQSCGRKDCYLEAHHLNPFSKILCDNKIKSYEMAMNCVELWNINNGITLCLDCHNTVRLLTFKKIKEK